MPVFAFFAAGVSVIGTDGLGVSLTDPITLGIVAGLVVGKTVGVLGVDMAGAAVHPRPARRGAELVGRPRHRHARRDRFHRLAADRRARLRRRAPRRTTHVKIGVLLGSLLSALLAAVVLRVRNGVYRRMQAEEERDIDADGIPDVYKAGESPS